MAHDIVFIKDERDDYRRRQSLAIQPLYAELARRYRLPFRAPLYLIQREMEVWFTTGKLPVKRAELRQRMRGYCLAIINGQPVQIRSGLAMHRFLAKQKFISQENTRRQLRGTIGNQGTARGRVALVRTVHDLRRVKEGNVLVAVTTNPDYVPVMRKSCAIVTDEGGITSHAAIVARELNIPCLVGTKTATKKFRDGDRVEVDATHGVVRKLS
jgi:phosphohistidine swiveling domain-containing protein